MKQATSEIKEQKLDQVGSEIIAKAKEASDALVAQEVLKVLDDIPIEER